MSAISFLVGASGVTGPVKGWRSTYLHTVKHRREQASRVAEADQGHFMRGEALDDVVDRDVGRAANEDAEVALEELEDKLDKGVCFSGLRGISIISLHSQA
jgi:hypothetical protein